MTCQSFIMNFVFHMIVGVTIWKKKNLIQTLKVHVKYSDLFIFFTPLAQSYKIRLYKKITEKQIISLAP